MMNRFEVIGRNTKDIELRYTKDGKEVVSFTVAINNNGNDTTFLKVDAFGKTAKLISEYVKKGDLLFIDGMIRNNDYEDKNGVKHHEYSFICGKVQFLSSKKKEEKKNNIPSDEEFEKFGKSIEINDKDLAF